MTRTREQQAEEVLNAVVDYLRSTARAHPCAGFDCRLCSLNGDRWEEAKNAILEVL